MAQGRTIPGTMVRRHDSPCTIMMFGPPNSMMPSIRNLIHVVTVALMFEPCARERRIQRVSIIGAGESWHAFCMLRFPALTSRARQSQLLIGMSFDRQVRHSAHPAFVSHNDHLVNFVEGWRNGTIAENGLMLTSKVINLVPMQDEFPTSNQQVFFQPQAYIRLTYSR